MPNKINRVKKGGNDHRSKTLAVKRRALQKFREPFEDSPEFEQKVVQAFKAKGLTESQAQEAKRLYMIQHSTPATAAQRMRAVMARRSGGKRKTRKQKRSKKGGNPNDTTKKPLTNDDRIKRRKTRTRKRRGGGKKTRKRRGGDPDKEREEEIYNLMIEKGLPDVVARKIAKQTSGLEKKRGIKKFDESYER